jgi:hypothetical protein
MRERDWLLGDDPQPLLDFVRQRATERQLRLFGCACCRRVWHLMTSRRSLEAVVAVERYVERLPGGGNLPAACAGARQASESFPTEKAALAAYLLTMQGTVPTWYRVRDAARLCVRAAIDAGGNLGQAGALPVRELFSLLRAERAAQANLVREVFGNPFRVPAVEPAWLAWQGGLVARLAEAIHSDDRFAEVPVLGDALEEAGCPAGAILDHCRNGAPHYRGCWLVDLVRSRCAG